VNEPGRGTGKLVLLWPLLTAIALRLAALPLAASLPALGDSRGYLGLAREFRDTGTFRDTPSGIRPPLYRVLVAPGLDTSVDPSEPFPGVYLIQIATDVLACALLMELARRRFGRRAAAATGWLYALYPQAILFSSTVILTEAPVCLVVAAALLALGPLETPGAGGRRWLAALRLGAVLGVGLLVKETVVLVVAAAALALLLQRDAAWRRLATAGLVIAAAFAVTLPWGLNNLRQHGAFVASGTFGDFSLLLENAPPGVDACEVWGSQPDLASRRSVAREALRREIRQNPGRFAASALARLRVALGPELTVPAWLAWSRDGFPAGLRSVRDYVRAAWRLPRAGWGGLLQLACGVSTVLFFALACAGLGAAPSSLLRSVALILAVLLLGALALSAADSRYRHSLFPAMVPFAGLALAALTDREGRAGLQAAASRRLRVAAVACAAVLAVTVFVLPAP